MSPPAISAPEPRSLNTITCSRANDLLSIPSMVTVAMTLDGFSGVEPGGRYAWMDTSGAGPSKILFLCIIFVVL